MRNKSERLFPMFVDISDWPILVVGAGKIAQRRIETLLQFALSITVVAPECSKKIRQWAQEGKICLKQRAYVPQDLDGMRMVCAATSQNVLNEEIGQECRKKGILVNVCSDKMQCDFHFPGIVKNDSYVVGINGGGRNHHGVAELRGKVEKCLEDWEEHEE